MSDDLFAIGSTNQAPGAWPNGTRVFKVDCEPGDIHLAGSRGTVLDHVTNREEGIVYYVRWDSLPGSQPWIARIHLVQVSEVRTCRVCGCTDDNACIGFVSACYWIEPDLCSNCR